jgi:hypothetical protein
VSTHRPEGDGLLPHTGWRGLSRRGPPYRSLADDPVLTDLLEGAHAVIKSWETVDEIVEELIEGHHVVFEKERADKGMPSRPFDRNRAKEIYKSVYDSAFGVHLRAWLQTITELRTEGYEIEFRESSHRGESPRIVAPNW